MAPALSVEQVYQFRWARDRIVSGTHQGPIYNERWTGNETLPVCA